MKCPKCGSEMLPLKKWLNEKVSRIVDRCLSCGHEEKVGGEPEPTVEISIHWAGKPPEGVPSKVTLTKKHFDALPHIIEKLKKKQGGEKR
jgi:uncharacterized Zn finger protein